MELKGEHVIVVGLGRSGLAAASLCLQQGATVTATDANGPDPIPSEWEALRLRGAVLRCGGHHDVDWQRASLVVVSPGVSAFPALLECEERGIPVIGELELASRFVDAPIALIGGTNGKSTVTTLVGMMLGSPESVFVGGNLGTPFAESVGSCLEAVVLEISSFQAERIPSLHAKAAALLNVTPDHLDRYPNFEAYAHAKGNMFVRMTCEDTAVVPFGDALCSAQARRGKAKIVTFGPGGDIALIDGQLVHQPLGWRFPREWLRLGGQHNTLNACAAIGMAAAMGATDAQVAEALKKFEGLSHRTVAVASFDGVTFYDDSKGTNVGATVAALEGLEHERVVLIAGGRDKHGSYEPLVAALKSKGRGLVLIGEAAERIESAVGNAVPVRRASTMDEAVEIAQSMAHVGDAVLLSPACSSFDMFRNYGHRGDAFALAVKQRDRSPGVGL